MKKVIFTMHFDLGDGLFGEYHQRLLDNKRDYAKSVNADFVFFDDIGEVDEFSEKFRDENRYVAINNYKLWILESFAADYDEILYLDFDVVVNTDENFFDAFDLSDGVVIEGGSTESWFSHSSDFVHTHKSHSTKTIISKEILGGVDSKIINTGVVGCSRADALKLNFRAELPGIIEKIEAFVPDDEWVGLITPNNEAIFGYLLEKNQVAHQDAREWHDIRDSNPSPAPLGKFVHYVNKCFWNFFKDKSVGIFSLYVNIEDSRMVKAGAYQGDTIDKNDRTRLEMDKYHDRLLQNHEDYAKAISGTYIHFSNDQKYSDFKEWMLKCESSMSEYNIINFYKIWLMYEMAKDFDHVLYLDFDVVADTEINFFDVNDVENFISVFYEENEDGFKREARSGREINYRSPCAKYWNALALLEDEGMEGSRPVFNTGIVGISRTLLKKLGYFDDFEELISTMTSLRSNDDEWYPENIAECFGYDNETVFSFKVFKNEVKHRFIGNSSSPWHGQVTDEMVPSKEKMPKQLFLHFINKKFSWFF